MSDPRITDPLDGPADAPAGASRRFSDLGARVGSGAALAVVASAAVYLGGPAVAVLAAAAAAAMAWEYRRFVRFDDAPAERQTWLGPLFIGLAAAAPIIAYMAEEFMAAAIFAMIAALGFRYLDGRRGRWTAPGFLIIAAATAAFVWMRELPEFGLATIVWLVCVVAATDIGGYFAGNLIGGPKLAPKLSPKKTWSGLAGSVLLAFLVGALFSWLTTGTYAEEVCAVSAVASLVAVMGDLGESRLKRRFDVKDASNLIPGHGGALDRLDGLMAATLVVAAVTFVRGKEVFIW